MRETPEEAVAKIVAAKTDKTPEKKKPAKARFLDAYAVDGTVTNACKAAGIVRSTAYMWRDTDADFAEAWEDAKEAGIESLEREARRRAMGRSDTLLIFLLKAARPEVYAENRGDGGDAKAPVTIVLNGVSTEPDRTTVS